MQPVVLHIKNMVCPRCIKVVREELTKGGFNIADIELGTVVLSDVDPDTSNLAAILEKNGFELLEERVAKTVNDIKSFVITYIRSGKLKNDPVKLSALLESYLHKDYNYLSQLFSQSENNTLEKFIISQKIELVKEWLVYDELTLSQIADELGYSSTAHLSNQFKQVTGFSTSAFKKLKNHHRKHLDSL